MTEKEFEKVFAAAAEKSGVAGMARDYQLAENLEAMMCELRDKLNSLPAEKPSEEVNKEIDRFIADKVGKTITVGQVAHYFAKWQKEQLMKSAINGCYVKRNKYTKENVLNGFSVTCEAIQKFKDGDKVKVIIVKEAEQ